MKNIFKNIRAFLKSISFAKKTDAPSSLYTRFYKILGMSILSLAIMLACIVCGMLSLTLIISFGVLSVGLFTYALLYKHSLETKGFTVIRGKITFVKEGISTSADTLLKSKTMKRPSYYLLKGDDGKTYRFAANKVDDELPVGSAVKLYAPKDVETYERSGITYLTVMWGYELDSDEEFLP